MTAGSSTKHWYVTDPSTGRTQLVEADAEWEASKSVGSNGQTVLRLKGSGAFEVGVWAFSRRCQLR